MNKIVPIAIVAIIVIGAGVYMVAGRSLNQSPSQTSSTETDSSMSDEMMEESESFTGTLADAVKLGIGMKCSYEVDGNEYEGYVKGENYRGKILTDEETIGEVIVKDNCMWSWSSEASQGIKTCYQQTEMEEDADIDDSPDVWESTQGSASDMAYKCNAFNVSDDTFTPPSGVEFVDLDSMMEGMQEGGSEMVEEMQEMINQ